MPGDPEAHQFREAWTMGLTVIVLYPLSCLLIYGSNLVVWMLSVWGIIGTPNLVRWQQISIGVAIAIFMSATLKMVQALKAM